MVRKTKIAVFITGLIAASIYTALLVTNISTVNP